MNKSKPFHLSPINLAHIHGVVFIKYTLLSTLQLLNGPSPCDKVSLPASLLILNGNKQLQSLSAVKNNRHKFNMLMFCQQNLLESNTMPLFRDNSAYCKLMRKTVNMFFSKVQFWQLFKKFWCDFESVIFVELSSITYPPTCNFLKKLFHPNHLIFNHFNENAVIIAEVCY